MKYIILTEPAPGYGFRTTADAIRNYALQFGMDIPVYSWVGDEHFNIVNNAIWKEDCLVCCMTLPVCEHYHKHYQWPRHKMVGIFYSMWEMVFLDEQLHGRAKRLEYNDTPGNEITVHMLTEQRMRENYISPELQSICNEYYKVGYLNNKQVEMLPDVKNLVYIPHAAKSDFFMLPHQDESILTVGISHRSTLVKNMKLADQIKRYCDSHSDRFRFVATGTYGQWFTHDKMPNFYKQLDVFLVTSYSEGTPFVAYEAGAAGVPIISTNCGSMPEYLTSDNGFIVEANAEAFIEKLNYLFEHRKMLRQMKINMYNRTLEDHCYDVVFPYWLNLFGEYNGPTLKLPCQSLENLPPYPVPKE